MPIFAGLGLILLALWIFCIVDVITSDDSEVRNLPKIWWLLIVLMVPTVGSIVWLIAGRPQTVDQAAGRSRHNHPSRFPEYDRPGRRVAANPDDDEDFLRQLRKRAEEQRRAADERPRKTEDES